MPGPWERYQTPAASGAPVASPRPLPSPPRPVDPYQANAEQRAADAAARAASAEARANEAAARERQRFEQEQADRAARMAPAGDPTAPLTRILGQLQNVRRDAQDNGGWGETGAIGSIVRRFGPTGTAAYDLSGQIQSIDANLAFEELANMRRNSPTGGALGQVTERELDLLRSTVANLDPNLSQEEFLRQVDTAIQHYRGMIERLAPPRSERGEKQEPPGGYAVAAQPPAGGQPGQPDNRPVPPGVTVEGVDPQTGDRYGYRIVDGQQVPWGEISSPPNITAAADRGMGDSSRGQGGFGETVDAFIRGAADTSSFGFSDELTGIMNAITYGDTTVNQEIDRQRAVDAYDAQHSPWARLTGQVAGAFLNPLGAAGNAIRGGRVALTAGGAMREGAVFGGLYGFGSGEGNPVERLPSAGIGAAVGGAGGAALGGAAEVIGPRIASRLATGGNPRQLERAQLLGDFTDQGVTPLPANVGGPGVNRLTSAAGQSPVSAGRVVEAFQRQGNEMQAAVGRAAESVGTPANTETAGAIVRGAGERIIQRTRDTGNRLYERAARLAGDVRVRPQQALQVIDDELTRLNETADINAPLIAELQRFRQSLAGNEGLSIDGIRTARTIAGRASRTEALRATDAQRSLGMVMNAISADIEQGLVQAGRRGAAEAFRRADDMWRQRVEYIDQTLEPLIGRNRSGESIIATLEGYTRDTGRGNAARLRQVLRALEPQELGDIQATLINRMGRATNGQQDATGEAFSASRFLTNWNSLSPQSRNLLFQGELRQNIDQIARVAGGMRDTGRYANFSNTGGVVGWLLNLGAVGVDLGTAGALAAGQYLNGRLMTSPGFTRWLARAPREGVPQGYIRRLETIATREPAIAADIRGLQRQLEQAFAASPTRAAASGQDEQNRGQIPPQ